MFFDILGPIRDIETFARGSSIREFPRLRKRYGKGRWRKRKGLAKVRLPNGNADSRDSLVRSIRNRKKGTEDQAFHRL